MEVVMASSPSRRRPAGVWRSQSSRALTDQNLTLTRTSVSVVTGPKIAVCAGAVTSIPPQPATFSGCCGGSITDPSGRASCSVRGLPSHRPAQGQKSIPDEGRLIRVARYLHDRMPPF
jgi:hypothetical protein